MKTSAQAAKRLSPRSNGKSSRYFTVPKAKGSSRYSNGLAQCQPISSSGHNGYGAEAIAETGKEYLAMVVQRPDGDWNYVRVNQHCLDCVGMPVVFEVSEAHELLELWKRVTIDDAIPWEDSVRPETLRIVSFKMEIEDRTLTLFNNESEVDHMIRTSALSKLTDIEARALGLTHAKAVQALMHNPEFHRDDGRALTALSKASAQLPLTGAMRHITPT